MTQEKPESAWVSAPSGGEPDHDDFSVAPAPATHLKPVIRLKDVSLNFGSVRALNSVTLDIPAGKMVGMIGPDGVGKSSLMSLITGARVVQKGRIEVLGGNIADKKHRLVTCPDIAYMPQGLGKNLYQTLSVNENAEFFARLFGLSAEARHARIEELLKKTGLNGFEDRPAGKLSGGMKQKLGLICSLVHEPRLLVLDEPTTGVDPLSRRQFWDLIDMIRAERDDMSVLVATAYMEEAARFDWLIAMYGGEVLATGTPQELLQRTGTKTLDDAFIALMPEAARINHEKVVIKPHEVAPGGDSIAIEAEGLFKRFGDFVAVENVNFRIAKGEIFGFLGSNGCGKTTTMKMLTGLLPVSEGTAKLFGRVVEANDMESRRHVGYMSQAFSLYSELTVYENLKLHARLFELPKEEQEPRIQALLDRFELNEIKDAMPNALPLGLRQRMSLAVALIHKPALLILDEPTSGVDPIARDELWQTLGELARKDNVTIFISTHFMNEAERCDRISLMHAGKVMVSDTPANITKSKNAATLEEAFISYLDDAIDENEAAQAAAQAAAFSEAANEKTKQKDVASSTHAEDRHLGHQDARSHGNRFFAPVRMLSYAWRETLELKRDPLRATMALLGSVILMFVVGYGINLEVSNLNFAVLDYDNTAVSRDYVQQISGSRYFTQKPDIRDEADMEERLRSGDVSLAIVIPSSFAANLARGRNVEVGAWLDGAMPQRAETIRGYVLGMHSLWLQNRAKQLLGKAGTVGDYKLEVRFRYNPDVESLTAMVPAVIPILLLIIPAMLAALSVVREKEMGSILNLYVTPTTRTEFLLGKQLPYVVLALLNCLLLWLFAVTVFQVPFTGSFIAFFLASVFYVVFATAFGLLISTFMKSQIAAIFGVAVLSLLPALQFAGMIDPVSSLQGLGAFIGKIYPTSHYIIVSRGTFSKALEFHDLARSFIPLVISGPLLVLAAALLTRKQER